MKFRINGWIAIFLALVVLSVSVSILSQAREVKKEAASLVGSVPLAQSDVVVKKAPAPSIKNEEIVSHSNGKQEFGEAFALPQTDEITGKRSLMICQRGPGTAICTSRGGTGTVGIMSFEESLDSDYAGFSKVEIRYVLRDGTAVVRNYSIVVSRASDGRSTTANFNGDIVDDVETLMSRSEFVVARAKKLTGGDAYIRIKVDSIDWIASRTNNRLVVVKTNVAQSRPML